jgi:hypothetical protein
MRYKRDGNEDEDVEIEDLDTDVEDEDEAKPAKKKSSTPEVEFGVSDLCAYLTKKTGKEIKPRELRTLIRKMAREDDPRVDREVIPGNRSRYDWKGGLKNPEVKKIIAAVTKGEMEADKKEKLEQLKADKAKKTAAKKKAADKAPGKKGKGKGKKVADPEPDDEEIEEIELDEDDD